MISLNKFLVKTVFLTTIFSVVLVTAEEVVTNEKENILGQHSHTLPTADELKKVWNEVATEDNINWLKDCKNLILGGTEKLFINNSTAMYALSGFCYGRAAIFSQYARTENLPQGMARAAQKGLNRNVFVGTGLLIANVYYNKRK